MTLPLPLLLTLALTKVLALDSDVILLANPYPPLRAAFGDAHFVTAFDTKGGFANVNVGAASG